MLCCMHAAGVVFIHRITGGRGDRRREEFRETFLLPFFIFITIYVYDEHINGNGWSETRNQPGGGITCAAVARYSFQNIRIKILFAQWQRELPHDR